MTINDRLTTLDTLWSVWAEHGLALTDEQWRRPTRLGTCCSRSLPERNGPARRSGAWPERQGAPYRRLFGVTEHRRKLNGAGSGAGWNGMER